MSRGRTILVLLILAAGLGAFFYYDTYSLGPRREKAESAKGRIWTVEPKDVERVTLARKGETMRLQRTADGGWEMLEPIKTRGDRGTVDDMVTGLATARMDREIDANPAKPSEFGLDPPEAEVKLDVNGDQIGVVADEPGKWRIVKPRALRADNDLIAEFLDKLEGAKAVEFVDDAPKSLQPYGLDKPSKVTVWVGRDKDRAARTLLVGRPVPEKKGVYVKREGEPGVILTAEAVWTTFPKTVAALRDKMVVSYAADKLAKVEIIHGRETLGLEKEGTGWKITAPETLRADSGPVTQLLWKIRDLQALGFLSEGAAEVPRFLSKPEVIVRLWETGAKEPKTLLLQSSNE